MGRVDYDVTDPQTAVLQLGHAIDQRLYLRKPQNHIEVCLR